MKESENFYASDADVILQTSDEVRFGVYQRILVESSHFFRVMFSLPQGCSDDEENPSPPPVIEVPERSDVMNALLMLIYPGTDPDVKTLDEVSAMLTGATKYDMVRAIATLRRLLVSPPFVEKDPVRVYAIACRYDLEPEARIASSYTLGTNVLDSPLSEDLKHISAWSYHQLLVLHRRRADAALQLLDKADLEDIKCMQCSSAHYGSSSPPRWWTEFLGRAKEELRARPITAIVFSMKFLAESGQTGCQRCTGSILESYAFLERLRKSIDDLPNTI